MRLLGPAPPPLELPIPLINMEMHRPPLLGAGWLSPQTTPTVPPLLVMPACHCNMGVGLQMMLLHHIWKYTRTRKCQHYSDGPFPGPSPVSAPAAAMAPSYLQPRLAQPEGTTSLINILHPHRGNASLCLATSFGEQAPATCLHQLEPHCC